MWAICKKELVQYFSSLIGYLAIVLFLVLNGLFLFVFSSFNILDFGYATLESFFTLAPYILMLLVPAITMRLLPDEYRNGTMEILRTEPIAAYKLVGGKYIAAMIVITVAMLPTMLYIITIDQLKAEGTSLDIGAMICAYGGLFLLAGCFAALSICCSSFTRTAVVAFLISLFACLVLYAGFGAFAALPAFRSGADYYLEMPGAEAHYRSIARGVIDSKDLVYLISLIVLMLYTTVVRTEKKN